MKKEQDQEIPTNDTIKFKSLNIDDFMDSAKTAILIHKSNKADQNSIVIDYT